jgi:hypothetical protein
MSRSNNHGGARPGAGRKKSEHMKARIVKIPDDIWEPIPKPKARHIREALKIYQAPKNKK